MNNIHTLKFLPSTQVIQNVSAFSVPLANDNLDFEEILVSLKKIVFKHDFISKQDNSRWASLHGSDYLENPKLFAQAPLTYVWAFISEFFKRYEVEEISKRLPKAVLQKALSRLAVFSR